MKKVLFFAVCAIALTSCSKALDTPEFYSNKAIGFNTWTENLTKAHAQGSNSFANGDDMKVFGVKSVTSPASSTTVFDAQSVSYDGTDWSYSPIKFWDYSTDNYTFFAYSNVTGSVTYTASNNNGTFVQAAEQTFAGNNGDALVASKKVVAKANYGSEVEMVFNHIASLVEVKVKAASLFQNTGSNYPQIKLNSVTLNAIENKGSFSISSAYTDNKPVATWTNSTSSTANYTNASGVTPVTTTGLSFGSDSYQTAVNTLIVMPQTISDTKTITVNYDVIFSSTEDDKETFARTIKLNEFRSTADTESTTPHNAAGSAVFASWAQGNKYIYNITIGASAIEFSASITDWTANNGYWWIAQ